MQTEIMRVEPSWDVAMLGRLIDELLNIRCALLATERSFADIEHDLCAEHLLGAQNLLHYIALRQYDIRPLQAVLASIGLSSLGRSESHVMSTINSVLKI